MKDGPSGKVFYNLLYAGLNLKILKSRLMLILLWSERKGLSLLKLLSPPLIVADLTNIISCSCIRK